MTFISITGNATSDPELRYTQSGKSVANFSVAASDRMFDKATNEWKDGDTLFLRVSVWGEQAERAAAAVTKGKRVTVSGKLKQRAYETQEGEKRSTYEVEADDVAVSLKFTGYTQVASTPADWAPSSRADENAYAEADESTPF